MSNLNQPAEIKTVTVIALKGSLNVIIDIEKGIIEFTEYGEHLMWLTVDELKSIKSEVKSGLLDGFFSENSLVINEGETKEVETVQDYAMRDCADKHWTNREVIIYAQGASFGANWQKSQSNEREKEPLLRAMHDKVYNGDYKGNIIIAQVIQMIDAGYEKDKIIMELVDKYGELFTKFDALIKSWPVRYAQFPDL